MLRFVALAGVWLAAGIGVSTALAVGLARYSPLGLWEYPLPATWDDMGPPLPDGTPCTMVWSATARGIGIEYGLEWREECSIGACTSTAGLPRLHRFAGWPLKMLRSDYQISYAVQYSLVAQTLSMPDATDRKLVPGRVVWSGLVGNAAIFGLGPWLMWRGLVAGRGHLRRRGGLCGCCGYDFQRLEKCPECGRLPRGMLPLLPFEVPNWNLKIAQNLDF